MKLWGREHAQAKGFRTGTHRACSPEDTWNAVSKWMPEMGITRVANITGLDRIGVPVCVAIRPNSRALSTSQGKGLDLPAARASALMESIESWHAERVHGRLRHESYRELKRGSAVLDIAAMRSDGSPPASSHAPRLWIEGWDLLGEEAVWVPYEAVTLNFVRNPLATPSFVTTSNGLASGNHPLEATLHAVLEVLERDARVAFEAQSWSEVKRRQVDLGTVTDPACQQVLRALSDAGVFVAAWDITVDARVPTYFSMVLEGDDRPRWRALGSFSGSGAHLCREVALLRALTEAIQSRLTFISGSRDDVPQARYLAAANEDDRRAHIRRWTEPAATWPFLADAGFATDSFEGDLQILVSRLREIGISRAAVVDLTIPEVGIAVVKVVIPGLNAPGAGKNRTPA